MRKNEYLLTKSNYYVRRFLDSNRNKRRLLQNLLTFLIRHNNVYIRPIGRISITNEKAHTIGQNVILLGYVKKKNLLENDVKNKILAIIFLMVN